MPETTISAMSQALALWVDLTGVDPANRYGVHTMGEWDIQRMHEAIKEALDLDPTDVTAYYLLDHFAADYFANRKFSVAHLMANPDKVADYLKKSHALDQLLKAPDVIAAGDVFADTVKQATARYDAATPEVLKIIQDRSSLGFLRRDALRSIQNLRVDQFLVGEPEKAAVKPIYNKIVHQFINVNSLLSAAASMSSGVSLNLVRHPDGFQSYFAFTVRNGGNLFLVTDMPNYAHPLQGYMSRRPERRLGNRIAQNWFPYDLLGLTVDDFGEVCLDTPDPSLLKGVVPYQSQLHPLTFINKLDAQEIIWLTLMFDLLVDKFWTRGYQAPALSCTGEMLKIASPVLAAAQAANLPVPAYQDLGLTPLTLADIGSDRVSEEDVGKKYGHNNWLEDRFRSQVEKDIANGMDILNRVAPPDVTAVLDSPKNREVLEKTQVEREDSTAVAKRGPAYEDMGGVLTIPPATMKTLGHFDREALTESRWKLATLDASGFNTRERMSNDRMFIARHNYALRIDQLALAEYTQRKDEVKEWVKQRIRENLPNLEGLIVQGTVVKPLLTAGWGAGVQHEFMRTFNIKNDHRDWLGGLGLYGNWPRGKRNPTCLLNDTAATYAIKFSPADAGELALLCGCEVEQLPDVLQHWTDRTPHGGNHLLNRIDPMDWVVRNPWCKLGLSTTIYLSIRALAAMEKRHPKPAV